MSDILDLIDGAIYAHDLSADAMRWSPEPVDEIADTMSTARISELFGVPVELLGPAPARDDWLNNRRTWYIQARYEIFRGKADFWPEVQ
jgi:hypothetical protein